MAEYILAQTTEVSPTTGKASSAAGADKVEAKSLDYSEMEKHWQLPVSLMNGTQAMQEKRELYLPREKAEDADSYFARLQRTFLYGAYRDTVDKIVAKPFSKPITVQDEEALDPRLQELMKNADKLGSNISQFASDVMRWGTVFGHTFVLVNFPRTQTEEQQRPLSVAEERAMDVRPFLVHIRPDMLLGWRYVVEPTGKYRLTSVRWMTEELEDIGQFGQQRVKTIHQLTEESWFKWQYDEDANDYVIKDSGTNTRGEITLYPFYTNATGFFTSRPPLEGLAELNLAHFQSLSDQRNLLHVARVPIIFMKGFSPEEITRGIVVGAGSVTGSSNENAALMFVEHSGRALEAGRQDLMDLEERMTVLGLQPFVGRTGNETATGRAMDEAKTHTNIQEWVRGLEEFLETLFQSAAKWISVELPESFSVNVFSDFALSLRSQAEVDALIKARIAGEIDRETFIDELRRRGLLMESVTYEEIRRRLDNNGENDEDDDDDVIEPDEDEEEDDNDEGEEQDDDGADAQRQTA